MSPSRYSWTVRPSTITRDGDPAGIIEASKFILYRYREFNPAVLTDLLDCVPAAREFFTSNPVGLPEAIGNGPADHPLPPARLDPEVFTSWTNRFNLSSPAFEDLAEMVLRVACDRDLKGWPFDHPLESPVPSLENALRSLKRTVLLEVDLYPAVDGVKTVQKRVYPRLSDLVKSEIARFNDQLSREELPELNSEIEVDDFGHPSKGNDHFAGLTELVFDLRHLDWLMLFQAGYSHNAIREWEEIKNGNTVGDWTTIRNAVWRAADALSIERRSGYGNRSTPKLSKTPTVP